MNRIKAAQVSFWICAAGAAFDTLAMTVVHAIPVLVSATPIFAISALAFAVGMIANYLLAPPAPRSKSRTDR